MDFSIIKIRHQKSLNPAPFILLSILLFENLDVNLQVNQQNKRSEQVKPTIIEVFLLF